MATVFDVALYFIQKTPRKEISAISLQKLCFYAFGWYAYGTISPLFNENFWAMKHGPVVGELLSAHAGSRDVSAERVNNAAQTIWQDQPQELSPYEAKVLDAVWDFYGHRDKWDLRDLTHTETIWVKAWDNRPHGVERAAMLKPDIIEYFFSKPVPEGLHLPERCVSVIDEEPDPDFGHGTFIDDIRQLCRS
ncbi:DUF4065 domain-containing protein [Actinotignum schaalii]|uniref:Panacea domain-containing protein n=1 Tax=Actinotignum schaalii TaxID=59505 RepID=UPI00237EE777|nr:type II toxin-antitoxin system antitoxin SocA domain-containing protein [Actinotignum schaalii]MDE1655340.1 DUF4065 domain-containing protein [Actinotignum schaalii]